VGGGGWKESVTAGWVRWGFGIRLVGTLAERGPCAANSALVEVGTHGRKTVIQKKGRAGGLSSAWWNQGEKRGESTRGWRWTGRKEAHLGTTGEKGRGKKTELLDRKRGVGSMTIQGKRKRLGRGVLRKGAGKTKLRKKSRGDHGPNSRQTTTHLVGKRAVCENLKLGTSRTI